MFVYADGSPYKKSDFTRDVVKVMKKLVVLPDGSSLSGHSWRMAAATRMAERGIADAHVGWSQDKSTGKTYVRPHIHQLALIANTIAHAPITISGLVLQH